MGSDGCGAQVQAQAQAQPHASSGATKNADESGNTDQGAVHPQMNGSNASTGAKADANSDTTDADVDASAGGSNSSNLGFDVHCPLGFNSDSGSGFDSGTGGNASSTLSGALGAGGSGSGTPCTSAFTPGGPSVAHFTPPRAFNRYAGYADYSNGLPGTDPSPAYEHLESDARFGEAYNLDEDGYGYGFEEKYGDEGYGEKFGDAGYEKMNFGVAQKQKDTDSKIDLDMDLEMDLDLDMDMEMDMELDMEMDADADVDVMRGIYGSSSGFGVRSMSGMRSMRGLETYGGMHGAMRGMRGLNGMHPIRGLHGMHTMRNLHGIRGVHGPRGLNRPGMHAHSALGGMSNNSLAATRCIPPALLTQSAAPSPLTTPLHTPGTTPAHTPGTTPSSSRAGSPERESESHAQPTNASHARAKARSKGHAATGRGAGATLALHPNSSKGPANQQRSRGLASQSSASSRTADPSAVSQAQVARAAAGAQAAAAARSAAVAAGNMATHPAKISTPSKPFPCPLPLCTKSYKQQNGLKYHLAHGACCYAPRDPAVEALSEGERERVERPWVCAVGSEGLEGEEAKKGCGRRYKNMNGLSECGFLPFSFYPEILSSKTTSLMLTLMRRIPLYTHGCAWRDRTGTIGAGETSAARGDSVEGEDTVSSTVTIANGIAVLVARSGDGSVAGAGTGGAGSARAESDTACLAELYAQHERWYRWFSPPRVLPTAEAAARPPRFVGDVVALCAL